MGDKPQPHRVQMLFLRLLIVAAVVVLSFRLYKLQIVEGARYRELADLNRLRTVAVSAPRGVVYDSNGQILVRNVPSFSVAIVPADLPKLSTGEIDPEAMSRVLDRLLSVLSQPISGTVATATPSPTPSPTPTRAPARGALTPTPAVTAIAAPTVERQPWVMARNDIETAIEQGNWGGAYKPVIVAKYIREETAFLVAEEAPNLPGVQLVLVPTRDYLTGTLTSHLLGYMGGIPESQLQDYESRGYAQNDQVGVTGLEKTYEDELRGKSGTETIEVDVNGRRIRTIGEVNAPEPGRNLVLTVDLQLQEAATKAVQKALDQSSGFTKATQGVAVVMDPRNGAIRAMVSLPSYDNNWFAKGITPEAWAALNTDPDHPMLNEAIAGQYPPGSTYKLIPASGGLQEGLINAQSRLVDQGGIMYIPNRYNPGSPGQPFVCWSYKYGYGHGAITVRDAIAESCDIFFYKLAGGYKDETPGLGVATLGYYAEQFGLGSPTGIDLEGESSGLVPTSKYKRLNYAEAWTDGDTYNMGIGQGFDLATPLQMANVTAAVANRGSLYRPQLVDHITDANGKTVRGFQPELIRKVAVDPANLDIVREGMYGTVNWNEGTAPAAKLPGITVAGKTGTAEFPRVDDKGQLVRDSHGNLPSHAWFTAFAPYEDPQIVVTVFIANGGEGSAVAVPVVHEIMKAYFHIADPTPVPPTSAAPPASQPATNSTPAAGH